MGALRSLWRWLFQPEMTPICLGLGEMFEEVAEIIRVHRPELYSEYMSYRQLPPSELGLFLDRHFPISGDRWGLVGVSDIAPQLRLMLEPRA